MSDEIFSDLSIRNTTEVMNFLEDAVQNRAIAQQLLTLPKFSVSVSFAARDIIEISNISEAARGGLILWMSAIFKIRGANAMKMVPPTSNAWVSSVTAADTTTSAQDETLYDKLVSFIAGRLPKDLQQIVVKSIATGLSAAVVKQKPDHFGYYMFQSSVVPRPLRGRLTATPGTPWCEVLFAVWVYLKNDEVWGDKYVHSVEDALRYVGGTDYLHCAHSDGKVWEDKKRVIEVQTAFKDEHDDPDRFGAPRTNDAVDRMEKEKQIAANLPSSFATARVRTTTERQMLQSMIDKVVNDLNPGGGDGSKGNDDVANVFGDEDDFNTPSLWCTRDPYTYYELLRTVLQSDCSQVVASVSQLPSPFDYPEDVNSAKHTVLEDFILAL